MKGGQRETGLKKLEESGKKERIQREVGFLEVRQIDRERISGQRAKWAERDSE